MWLNTVNITVEILCDKQIFVQRQLYCAGFTSPVSHLF